MFPLLICALFALLTRAIPIDPFVGNATGFYEAKTDDGSLPVFLPLDPEQKPDISIDIVRQHQTAFPPLQLAHTYLTILDELWRLKDATLIQKPLVLTSNTFSNIALRFQPLPNARSIFTTKQAAWATLEILDYFIKRSNRDIRAWPTNDSNTSGSNMTSLALEETTSDDDLLQSLSRAPQSVAQLSASDGTWPAPANLTDNINKTVSGPPSNERVTIDFKPTTDPLPWNQMLYQLRILLAYTFKSESDISIYDRWSAYHLLEADTRVSVQARMFIRERRGLFPVEVEFADVSEGLRLIVEELAKGETKWVGFETNVFKGGIPVFDVGFRKRPQSATGGVAGTSNGFADS